MVEITSVELVSDRRGWAVDVSLEGRRERRRYRYGSEAQARFFAAVFSLGPGALPPHFVRVRAPRASETPNTNTFELTESEFDHAFSELSLDLCG